MGRESRVQKEIRQGKPFASLGQEGVVTVLRTADVVRRRVAAVIDPHGITPQQYNVLRILRGAGPEGLPTLEIVERMIERAPGITRLLDRLEKKALVRRERRRADRRQVLCFITPSGLDLLASLDRPVVAADERSLGALSERELRALIRLLDRVRAGPG